MASAYKAYRAAGKASGSYKASLYEQQSIGAERAYEDFMSEFRQGQIQEATGAVTESIGLAKKVYGEGGTQQRKAETTEAIEGLQKAGFTVAEQDRTAWEKLTGKDKMYKFAKPGAELTDFTTDSSRIKQEYDYYKEAQMGLTPKKTNAWDEATDVITKPDKDTKPVDKDTSPANKQGNVNDSSWWDKLFGAYNERGNSKKKKTDVTSVDTNKDVDAGKIGTDAWLRKKSLMFAKKRQAPAFEIGGGLDEYNPRLLDISGKEGWSVEEQRWTY